jgi:hypothetical protein
MADPTQPIAAVSATDTRFSLAELERIRLENAQATQAQLDSQAALRDNALVSADQLRAQVQLDAQAASARLESERAAALHAEHAHTDALAERARIAGQEADKIKADRVEADRVEAKRVQTADEDAKRVESERVNNEALHERARLGAQAYQAETHRSETDALTAQEQARHLEAARTQTALALAHQEQQAEFEATHIDRVDFSDSARSSNDGPSSGPQSQ